MESQPTQDGQQSIRDQRRATTMSVVQREPKDQESVSRTMTVNELKQEIGFDPNYNSEEEDTANINNAASPKKE